VINLSFVRVADNPTGTRKSHLHRARMSNSGLSNRRVRSLPKKMTLSARPHFLNRTIPWGAIQTPGSVSGMDLRLLYVQYLAHDDHQNFNFLFRLR
jgi:hypothetical protein